MKQSPKEKAKDFKSSDYWNEVEYELDYYEE